MAPDRARLRGHGHARTALVRRPQVAESGGWPKNIDSTKGPVDRTIDKGNLGSFDNNATYGEMRLLARAYNATHDERYHDAFNRGLEFVLRAQYPTGGWPQRFLTSGLCFSSCTNRL